MANCDSLTWTRSNVTNKHSGNICRT